MQDSKTLASDWFAELRDRVCAEFEALEAVLIGTYSDLPPGKFTRKHWAREGGGGGEMSLMHGRVFEKVGVNISVVHGEFPDTLRSEIAAAKDSPKFWAAGISVVAHMRSPFVPAVHMNTRMLISGDEGTGNREQGTIADSRSPVPAASLKRWFGGGMDLTPVFPDDTDTASFHAGLKACCDRFHPDYYARYKKACDEYFFLKHRAEPRGVGGIFYDYLDSGNFEADFAFTRSVGEAFLALYPPIVRRHMNRPWSNSQREAQLVKRGRYVEFNLLYDRGTRFGLLTGGNPEAILMSLPPEVRWP